MYIHCPLLSVYSLASSEYIVGVLIKFILPCVELFRKLLNCFEYLQNYYIIKDDLKPKFKERRNGVKRIESYTRAIKAATERIKKDYHVDIVVEEKAGGTIQFTIVADSSERANNAVQHIQGEFCDVSEVYNYIMFLSQFPSLSQPSLSVYQQKNATLIILFHRYLHKESMVLIVTFPQGVSRESVVQLKLRKSSL